MKLPRILLIFALPVALMAQSPLKETLAYSRATRSGIPGNAGDTLSPFPTTFYIYIVAEKGAGLTVSGACVQGTHYSATLRKVTTPVTVDRDMAVPTGLRDTLVQRTAHDAYQVLLGEASGPCGGATPATMADLAQSHEVVVCLASGAARWYALVDKIQPLTPAAAM